MPQTLGTSIVDSLVGTVDGIRRDIHGIAGDRPYRVWQVWTRWTGQSRGGDAVEVLVRERELVPTPRVDGIGSMENALHAVGSDEEGVVTLSEISLTMTEAEVSPLAGTSALQPNEQFFYEVRYDGGRRRRFVPTGVPERDTRSVGWRVSLMAQDVDRNPTGTLYR